ncbi:IS66 family insertion sequence element accessory protein TnpB, partial [Bradyrhizobium sp. AS23.2]|uniref:IS66 family insertion sequence element accessory protein TnpB n=1 Tax=Bradyrhizobium sp. AS23.2 TaxID=1680155 RepID=UPI001160F70A
VGTVRLEASVQKADATDMQLSRFEDCMQNVACWADRVKLIYWDGTGVCLFAKRLVGKFRWPNVQDGVMRLSAAEFSALLEGPDWRRVHAGGETPAPVQPG